MYCMSFVVMPKSPPTSFPVPHGTRANSYAAWARAAGFLQLREVLRNGKNGGGDGDDGDGTGAPPRAMQPTTPLRWVLRVAPRAMDLRKHL